MGFLLVALYFLLHGLRLLFAPTEYTPSFPILFGEYRYIAGMIFVAVSYWLFVKGARNYQRKSLEQANDLDQHGVRTENMNEVSSNEELTQWGFWIGIAEATSHLEIAPPTDECTGYTCVVGIAQTETEFSQLTRHALGATGLHLVVITDIEYVKPLTKWIDVQESIRGLAKQLDPKNRLCFNPIDRWGQSH